MAIPMRHLALLAVVVLFVAVLPASAAHGGGSGSSSSHGGGSGSTMPAGFGNSGMDSTGPASHGPGETAARNQAGQEGGGRSPSQGGVQAGGENRAIAGRAAQEWPPGGGGAGEAGSPKGPGGVLSFGRIGTVQPSSGDDALPAHPSGRSRGPPSHMQPNGPGTGAGRLPCGPAQTAEPLSGATGPSDPAPSPSASPRSRRDGNDEESAPEPAGVSPAPFFFLPFLGFRRITGKNVLAHDLRGRVYRAIASHPGIDALSLAQLLETNPSTLRYHLFTLLRAEKITAFSRPGVVRYYPNQGMYPPFLQCLLHSLWTDTRREIIVLLWHTPGMTRTQLAVALACAGPSVTRQMQGLAEDGIVENRGTGRSNHYHLTAAAVEALVILGPRAGGPALPALAAPALPSAA